MPTLASEIRCQHTTLAVTSRSPTEFLDLTDRIRSAIAGLGLHQGFVNVQSLHTTAAIVVNEHEPLLLGDFLSFLERAAPRWATYRHDDMVARTVNVAPGERPNGHAHCQALVLPASVCLNVSGGALCLGRWQRVFLVELDGPRPREVSLMAMGMFEDQRGGR